MRSAQVTFDLVDPAYEQSFLQTYMGDAWERFESHKAFDRGWFWRFGNASRHGAVDLEDGTTLEDGGVILVLNGDPTPEPLVEQERPRWEALEDDGPLRGWDVKWFDPAYDNARDKSVQNFGAVGGDRAYRIRPLAARVSLEVLEEFDEQLPAVGTESDDNPVPVGFWTMIHYLMKQAGYDWYEEIDACTKAIENRLRSLAQFHGEEVAREELQAVIEELESIDVGG